MNISPQTVAVLRGQGWDVVRVSEVMPARATDAEILELARQNQRVVVTQDLDFSALLAVSGFDSPSVVTLRMTFSDPETITDRLQDVLPQIEDDLRQGCVASVDDVSVRVRRLPVS